MSKDTTLKLNSDHFTVMANAIVKGRQSMTLQAARLVRIMISQVVKEDKDLRTYTCSIKELASFLNIPRNNLYRDIEGICNILHKSVVYIGTGNPKKPWRQLNWISMSEYDGEGTLTIKLSEDIKPYVIGLEEYYTQYQLKNILSFNSFYAIRLYELIKCEDGVNRNEKDEIEFDVTELREAFDCCDKYLKFKDFRVNVIKTAVDEINQKSDIEIIPNFIKEGRAVKKISFNIALNKNTNNINSPIYKFSNCEVQE